MYEIEEFFDNNGLDLKEVLKSCIFSYYEKRFVFCENSI